MSNVYKNTIFDIKINSFLSFLIPLLLMFEFNIIGRLFYSEILCLIIIFFNFDKIINFLLKKKISIYLLINFLLFFIFQATSDYINNTSFYDYSRGLSKITFLFINFLAIFIVINFNMKRYIYFALGLSIGLIFHHIINPSEFNKDFYEIWKFGIGLSITISLIILSQICNYGSRISSNLFILLAVFLNLILLYRSLALICLAVFILCNIVNHENLQKNIFKIACLFLACLMLFYFLIDFGFLGEEAQLRLVTQSSGDYGLILGSRPEIFASSQAILDAPYFGHGSWAKNKDYVDLMNHRLSEAGYSSQFTGDLIPTHSYFFGSWVEAGIIGAYFWFFIFIVSFKSLFVESHKCKIIFNFFLILLMWNIFFSPFGAEARIINAFVLVIINNIFLCTKHA